MYYDLLYYMYCLNINKCLFIEQSENKIQYQYYYIDNEYVENILMKIGNMIDEHLKKII